jgi:hypothetical protein
MIVVASILFAAGFTYLVCLSAGRLALRRLNVQLYESEENFLGFVLGAALLSTAVFLLAAVGLAYRAVFFALGIGVILLAIRYKAHRRSADRLASLPAVWAWAFFAIYAAFAILYLSNALAPETSPDGVQYHLGFPVRYLDQHRLVPVTTDMYASLSAGIEMLFMFAFAFGKNSAAAMVHLSFLLVLPFGMLSYGKRIGMPKAGALGGLLFFLSPVAGRDGTVAYVDVATACICFAVFYSLQIWKDKCQTRFLAAIGLLAGFAYAAKYTAGLAVPYALVFAVICLVRKKESWLRPALVLSFCAALMIAPWMVKNIVVVHNPFAPFLNKYFRNPYFHISVEAEYLHMMRTYSGVKLREYPVEVTMKGGRLTGLLGPVFLLTPLMLLALRFPAGRQLVPAAILFLLTGLTNSGTRFLIPGLPFVSLSLAMVLVQWQWLGLSVLLAHAILCWPQVADRYAAQYSWRLEGMDWSAALRITPEEEILRQRGGDYEIGVLLDKSVPKGEPILCLSACPRAYNHSEIIQGFGSAQSDLLKSTIWSAIFDHMVPVWRHEYSFPEIAARGIRLVQTEPATNPDNRWSIGEVRIFSGTAELRPSRDWQLAAWPNPWDVKRAFDGNPVSSWDSWEVRKPGYFVEARFGREERLQRVLVECSHQQGMDGRMRLDYLTASGAWRPVGVAAKIYDVERPPGLARAAADSLKADGIRWLVYQKGDWGYDDFVKNLAGWGATPIVERNGYTLFRLD